jgi:hypothetical protein|tara:strand:+ start:2762 stop:3166 length:405 start_codon:yes stop_codon:yes gene_type:complete
MIKAKKKKKIVKKEGKKLEGYVCVNEAKLKRVINGSMASGGTLEGGLGEDASEKDILVAYDKLGGLITKNSIKVKTGSFYDFENKQSRKKPEVMLLFTDVQGTVVEVPEGKALPPTVAAAQYIEKEKAKSKKKK